MLYNFLKLIRITQFLKSSHNFDKNLKLSTTNHFFFLLFNLFLILFHRKCCHSTSDSDDEEPPTQIHQPQTVIINWEANGVEKSETIHAHANGVNGYSKNV